MHPNVHHLELFYFVARHEGITAAVRHMPYGIQQPAVSSQILQLEESLGVKLFNRRPSALTEEGVVLYDFIAPFFSGLADLKERVRGKEARFLRLAASATILGAHLPGVLTQMRKADPEVRLSLRECTPANAEQLLVRQETDVVISALQGKLAPGVRATELISVPLVLLVPEQSKVTSFARLPKTDDGVIQAALVAPPQNQPPTSLFLEELERRGLKWSVTLEVHSLELVGTYVLKGFGFGIAADAPGRIYPKGVRVIALKEFPPVKVGLLSLGKLKPIAEQFAKIAMERAKELAAKS